MDAKTTAMILFVLVASLCIVSGLGMIYMSLRAKPIGTLYIRNATEIVNMNPDIVYVVRGTVYRKIDVDGIVQLPNPAKVKILRGNFTLLEGSILKGRGTILIPLGRREVTLYAHERVIAANATVEIYNYDEYCDKPVNFVLGLILAVCGGFLLCLLPLVNSYANKE